MIPNLEERKKLLPRKHRYLFHIMEKNNKEWLAEGDVLREKREKLEREAAELDAEEEKQALKAADSSEKTTMNQEEGGEEVQDEKLPDEGSSEKVTMKDEESKCDEMGKTNSPTKDEE